MKSVLCMMALALLVTLAGCKTTNDKGSGGSDNGKSDSGKSGGETKATDMSDTMIKMYVDGQMKASPFVAIHEVVSTGQMWEVTSDFGAGKSASLWQIVKMSGRGEFIVENDTGQGYVLAYRVDSWADAGQPNVKEAWVGKKGQEPRKIEVMEWKPASGTAAPVESKAKVTNEKFADVKMGGKTFEGDLTIVEDGGNTTKTWVASNGWFNRVIRMDMNGKTVMELTSAHFDEKVKPLLQWEKPKAK